MTQDQYGQATGPGYVVRGDAVPEGEEYETEQSKPMTRFQKVASALRGDRTDQDEADRDELDRDEAYRAQATSREAENAAGTTEARTRRNGHRDRRWRPAGRLLGRARDDRRRP